MRVAPSTHAKSWLCLLVPSLANKNSLGGESSAAQTGRSADHPRTGLNSHKKIGCYAAQALKPKSICGCGFVSGGGKDKDTEQMRLDVTLVALLAPVMSRHSQLAVLISPP
jgi:hypothetical protein